MTSFLSLAARQEYALYSAAPKAVLVLARSLLSLHPIAEQLMLYGSPVESSTFTSGDRRWS